MQYELYLDVLLLTELSMNLILLFLTGKWMRFPMKWRRCALSAAAGAVMHAAVLTGMLITGDRKLLVLSPLIAFGMLKIAFPIKKRTLLLKTWFVFTGISFLLSGFMQAVNPLQRKTVRSFVLTVFFSCKGMQLFYRFFQSMKRKERNLYPVRFYAGDREYCAVGLLDTGNRLVDPWYHKPVHITEQSVLNDMTGETLKNLKLHMIPFHSIGKKEGVLMSVVIPRMVIETEEGELEIRDAVIAVSKEPVSSDGRYQMILHEECMRDEFRRNYTC